MYVILFLTFNIKNILIGILVHVLLNMHRTQPMSIETFPTVRKSM